MNVLRFVRVGRLDPEDAPDDRARKVWIASVASLFLGCWLAGITWLVMEWVLRPLDPMEDTLGSIHLIGTARTNVAFVLLTNVVILTAACFQFLGS